MGTTTTKMKSFGIRTQLIMIYGSIALLTFLIMVGVVSLFVFSFKSTVTDSCESNLKGQLEANSKLILIDAAEAFAAEMAVGESIAQTLAYAVGDAWSKGSSYSALPVPSYPDTTNIS